DPLGPRHVDRVAGRAGPAEPVRDLVLLERGERAGELEVRPGGADDASTPGRVVGDVLRAGLGEALAAVEEADEVPVGGRGGGDGGGGGGVEVDSGVAVGVVPDAGVRGVSSHSGAVLPGGGGGGGPRAEGPLVGLRAEWLERHGPDERPDRD